MATTKTLRDSARRKLPKVHARDGGICRYCRCQTVILREVPFEDRISVSPFTVQYLLDGETVSMAIASADHVTEIRNGGTSRMKNLVLACVKCNQKRDRDFYRKMTKSQRRSYALARMNKKHGNPQTTSNCQWPHSAVA